MKLGTTLYWWSGPHPVDNPVSRCHPHRGKHPAQNCCKCDLGQRRPASRSTKANRPHGFQNAESARSYRKDSCAARSLEPVTNNDRLTEQLRAITEPHRPGRQKFRRIQRTEICRVRRNVEAQAVGITTRRGRGRRLMVGPAISK